MEWDGFNVSQNSGYWDDGRASFSANVSSSVHRVTDVNTYVSKDWWYTPNGTPGIVATVYISGVRDGALNTRNASSSFSYNHNGLRLNEYSGLNYAKWYDDGAGSLKQQNNGYGGGAIDGVTWQGSDTQYNEWTSTIGKGAATPSLIGFQWGFTFHGYFEDAAMAKQYFGTAVPEPTSLGFLAAGTALVARRRRRHPV
jgi:hypothetical protein